MAKEPWIKFYTETLLADIELKSCSLSARGLWIYAFSLMHRNAHRGHLKNPDGTPMTAEQLSRMAGCSPEEADRGLKELIAAGVLAVTEDRVIYSRRMVREARLSDIRKQTGKKGGNPNLVNQKSTKGLTKPLTKEPTKPLISNSCISSLPAEEKSKDDVAPSEQQKELDTDTTGYGGVGERDLVNQNPNQNALDLTQEWIFYHAGDKGVLHRDRAVLVFTELLRHGADPQRLLAEIRHKDRLRTEKLWQFEKRVAKDRKRTEAEEAADILRRLEEGQ